LLIGIWLLGPHIAASEESPFDVYVVQPGDTLSEIADRFGTTVQAIAAENRLEDLNHIVTGTELAIPVPAASTLPVSTSAYEVQPGDTLWDLAAALGVSVSALAELNGLSNDSRLIIGSVLEVPVASTTVETPPDREHTVQAGETISRIAEAYGSSVAAIKGANGLDDADLIRAGQVLMVPAASLPELSVQTASVLQAASTEFGIDPYLLLALSLMESGWQSQVVSHAGAIGLMQVMPDTAEWTVDYLLPTATNWPVSIEDNARVGAAYLDHLLFIEGGDVEGALASYYQGWGSYKRDGMYDETRHYVDDVLALAERLRIEGG